MVWCLLKGLSRPIAEPVWETGGITQLFGWQADVHVIVLNTTTTRRPTEA